MSLIGRLINVNRHPDSIYFINSFVSENYEYFTLFVKCCGNRSIQLDMVLRTIPNILCKFHSCLFGYDNFLGKIQLY